MRAILLAAIAATAGFCAEFEYIFWGKIHAENLALSAEEFHLSRSMQEAAKPGEYEYACTIAAQTPENGDSLGGVPGFRAAKETAAQNRQTAAQNRQTASQNRQQNPAASQNRRSAKSRLRFGDEELFDALLAHKAALLECAQKVQIRNQISVKNLTAHEKSHLSVLPFRFLSELGIDQSIIIYARKEP